MAVRVSKKKVVFESIPLHLAKASALSVGATVDLSLATGNLVHISGSGGPITSFGSVVAGAMFVLVFDTAVTISYNASTMILNSGAVDVALVAGDRALVLSEGAGSWVVSIIKGDGSSIASSGSSSSGVVSVPSSRALIASDNGKTLTVTASSDITLTVPTGLPAGFGCAIYQSGTGAATVSGSGTVLTSGSGSFKTGGQSKITALVQVSTNTYSFSGGTA